MTALPELSLSAVRAKIHDLPSLPAVVVELLSTIDRDDVDLKTLSEKISHDQALSAKTLRLSNSSFYGMPRKISTIQQAISILGFKSVRTLVSAAAITSNFSAPAQASFDYRGFWRHSLATAVLAKSLARRRHVNEEQAFLCGLMHDIGRLVLASGFPQHYEAIAACRERNDGYPHEAERETVAIDHEMIGQVLAEHWKFPPQMQAAIGGHHAVLPQADPLVAVTHVADVMAHALDFTGNEQDLVPPLSEKVWAEFALSDAGLLEIYGEAEVQFEEVSLILMN